MAHNLRRGGIGSFILLGLDQMLAMLPGAAGDRAAGRMMARAWRNYFDPPRSAPAPSREWLDGVHSRPIFATRKAVLQAKASDLRGLDSVPVLIIFGESDIYGPTTQLLAVRYPAARFVVIPQAGHVPLLQNRAAFSDAIVEFAITRESSPSLATIGPVLHGPFPLAPTSTGGWPVSTSPNRPHRDLQRQAPELSEMSWMQRLKRVLAIDIETCRRAQLIERILEHLRLAWPEEPLPFAARAPPTPRLL